MTKRLTQKQREETEKNCQNCQTMRHCASAINKEGIRRLCTRCWVHDYRRREAAACINAMLEEEPTVA